MAEQLTHYLEGILSPELIIFVVSLLPILELRGGLIAAAILGVDWIVAFPICVIGNMLLIPLEILFIQKIFVWLKHFKPFEKMIVWIETRAQQKSKEIENRVALGLFLFVAIPIPGTGAWTGGLVANVLGVKLKKALPIITLGVITAGLIVSFISYVIPSFF